MTSAADSPHPEVNADCGDEGTGEERGRAEPNEQASLPHPRVPDQHRLHIAMNTVQYY